MALWHHLPIPFSSRNRPHKAEALHRIRLNALALLTLCVLAWLLPLPSVPAALKTVVDSYAHSHGHRREGEGLGVWVWTCVIESGMVAVMAYNLIEAFYALQYPPPAAAAAASSKPKSVFSPASPAPGSPFSPGQSQLSKSQRAFKVLSPHSSPQAQRPFSFSTSTSAGSFAASASGLGRTSSNGAPSGSTYVQSPESTPSRVLHYPALPPSASVSSTNASSSVSSAPEYLATPSPVISAYRGKHVGVEVGRALDGTYISMMKRRRDRDQDEDEDDLEGDDAGDVRGGSFRRGGGDGEDED